MIEIFVFNGTTLSFEGANDESMGPLGSGITADPKDYVAGSLDQTIISDLKQDVKASLSPPDTASNGDQADTSNQEDGTDGTQAAASDSDDNQAAPPPPAASNQSAQNHKLYGADGDAIGHHVGPCWTVDAGAPGPDNFSVDLQITTDATGTVREAEVAPQDQGKMGDPVFAAYANRAVAAFMNYQCATLPLPAWMLGSTHTFLVDFKP